MESRFTAFLIPVLIATLVYLLFFVEGEKKDANLTMPSRDVMATDPAVQKQQGEQPQNAFDENLAPVKHTFGTLGKDGFTVTWSKYGAAVRSIVLNDHYVSPTAARKETKSDYDYYPIVPYFANHSERGKTFGLVLEGRGPNRFKKSIDDGAKNQQWEVVPFKEGDDTVKFRLPMGDGLVLEKVFRYEAGRRDLAFEINLVNKTRAAAEPNYYDVALRGVQLFNPEDEHLLQNPAVAYGSWDSVEEGEVVKQQAPTGTDAVFNSSKGEQFRYAGTTNRFFVGLLYPEGQDAIQAVQKVTQRAWPVREFTTSGGAHMLAGSVPQVFYELQLKVPAVGQTTSLKYRLYLGPKSSTAFSGTTKDKVTPPEYAQFEGLMDKELAPACCCVPGMYLLSRTLVAMLTFFHGIVGNWGFAIIMLTLIVRMSLSPLNFNMQRTMRKHGEKMKELKPKLDALQARYKDDPKQLQAEMMKFNREHKLISAPLKGCLPLFLTMPIWFGLFTALRVMYELRGQPFFGYIQDLSKPDALFELGFGFLPYFNLLPIIMVLLWLYLQMATPLPKDPQQRQMMVMMRFMPVVMGVVLYNYAAGLMIYMCTSSVWGIIESKVTKKILGPMNPDASGGMPNMPMV